MAEKRRPSVRPFFRHRTALVLFLLAFTAGMCPVAGDTCNGVAVVLNKGEVVLTCPLTANVYQTKHSIVIKHFSRPDEAEDVLGCDWLSYLNDFNCLRSRVDAQLIVIQPDRVLARLPRDRVGNGTYRCQLVPPNHDDPFTDCDICDPEKATTSRAKTTTRTSIPAKTTTTTSMPAKTTTTTSMPATHANNEYLSTVRTTMAFTAMIFVLLVVIVLGWTVLLAILYRNPHRLRDCWTQVTGHRRPEDVEKPDEDPSQQEGDIPNRAEPHHEANVMDMATSGDPLLKEEAEPGARMHELSVLDRLNGRCCQVVSQSSWGSVEVEDILV